MWDSIIPNLLYFLANQASKMAIILKRTKYLIRQDLELIGHLRRIVRSLVLVLLLHF